MNWAGEGRFTYALSSVKHNQWYYVSGGDATTRRYAVRVLRRPAVAEFRIHYVYPAYTGRPPQTLINSDGVIEAPVGTQATVTITATEPLQAALLTANGEKSLMARASSAAADGPPPDNVREGRLTVLKQGPYQVDLIGAASRRARGRRRC